MANTARRGGAGTPLTAKRPTQMSRQRYEGDQFLGERSADSFSAMVTDAAGLRREGCDGGCFLKGAMQRLRRWVGIHPQVQATQGIRRASSCVRTGSDAE